MTNLDSIFKSRDITLPAKVRLVKAMVFPVVMYGCESWTVKKAERQRIDAFELWCWRRLLRAPWTTRISNQSILKEISPEYSSEGLMLKLNLQYFGLFLFGTSQYLPHYNDQCTCFQTPDRLLHEAQYWSYLSLCPQCRTWMMSNCSVKSNSWQPLGLQPARLLCPWIILVRILEWVTISSSRGSS